MDLIEFFMNQPSAFSHMGIESQSELISKRPVPEMKMAFPSNSGVSFDIAWYDEFPWLTGSTVRKRLYCFYCLLFNGEYQWGRQGVDILTNFTKWAKRHEHCKKHIACFEKYTLLANQFNSNSRPSSSKSWLAKVDKFKRLFRTVAQQVCTFGSFGLVDTVSGDTLLSRAVRYQISENGGYNDLLHPNFDSLSNIVQSYLIEAINHQLNLAIKSEMSQNEFLSARIYEVTQYTSCPSFAVTLRYCQNDGPREIFIGCVRLSQLKTPKTLSDAIIDLILKHTNGLIVSFSYGPGPTLSEILIPLHEQLCKKFNNSLLLLPPDLNLNYTLLTGCNQESVRDFASKLALFNEVFMESEAQLKEVNECYYLPCALSRPWEFNPNFVSDLKNSYDEIKGAVELYYDKTPLHDVCSRFKLETLLGNLNLRAFVYYLCLFDRVFECIRPLQNACFMSELLKDGLGLSKMGDQALGGLNELTNPETLLSISKECDYLMNPNIKVEVEEEDYYLHTQTLEVLNSISNSLQARLRDAATLAFFELLNHNKYEGHSKRFPDICFLSLINHFPLFVGTRLQNELSVVYSQESKYCSPVELWRWLKSSRLEEVYPQVIRLIELFITFPLEVDDNSRKLSERILTFFKSHKGDEQMKDMELVVINSDFIKDLPSQDAFYDGLVNRFGNLVSVEDILQK